MRKSIACYALSLALLNIFVSGTPAQPGPENEALRKEVELLRENQRKLQKDFEELKKLLPAKNTRSATQVTEAIVSINGSPFKGQIDAPLTLVEFSDYLCPFCARHVRQTFPNIYEEYVATGKLKYVFRDFPIKSIHPKAHIAHEAAHCAGEQGKYWQMHTWLFSNQKSLSSGSSMPGAEVMGLDARTFQSCLDRNKYAQQIGQGILDGRKAGVKGTPTFFLGYTDADHAKIQAAKLMRGAHPYGTFKKAIDGFFENRQK